VRSLQISKTALSHKWWHLFFTRWIETYSYSGRMFCGKNRSTETWYCSKCKQRFEIDLNDVEEIVRISLKEPHD
jgi:hypothetical protein